MHRVVIYGTGSPVLVDVEESLWRARAVVAAGVRNRPAPCHLSDPSLAITPEGLTPELKNLAFIVPLFSPGNRFEAVREACSLGFTKAFSLIDPTIAVPRAITYGEGLFVSTGCSLGAASSLGDFVFINRGASVGHHAVCASFASIGPGATVAGQVTIGRGTFIGAGAVILPKIKIGHNAVVGAGSVVTRDVPDFGLVVGNPARLVKIDVAGYQGKTVT